MTAPVVYTQEELEARCKLWQERLRLQDWRISITLVRREEIGEGVSGLCQPYAEIRYARIRVLDSIDFYTSSLLPYDHEHILVHELLHCHFPGFNADTSQREGLVIEQGVEALALSFLKAYRRIEELEAQCPNP